MNTAYYTSRLQLKTLGPDHASMVLAFCQKNAVFLQPFEPDRKPGYYTKNIQKKILEIEADGMAKGEMLRLWLFHKDDIFCQYPLGNLAFTNIIKGAFLSCFLGYKMDQAYINKGYMTEAVSEGIRIIFDDYKLHRIEANIMPRNFPSLTLAEKLGFVNEGLSISYLKLNDQWEDHCHYVLLNHSV
jgi:ribosomal-protein-alanine N-acetyltransferase